MSRYLVVGLGSMGKRRVRCLLTLGVKAEDIYGLDTRDDRRAEAREKYGINTVASEDEVFFDDIEAVVVSLPPDKHILGVELAARHKKPVFVEASVVLEDVKKIAEKADEILIAPSCTLVFHPLLKEIRKITDSQKFGKFCNFSYHTGQYLPDWHPWENVNDFYVSNRITGGGREIVPFELTWIVNLLGFPRAVKGYFRKTGEIGCEIEDSYAITLDYGDAVGTLLVDVMSRFAIRNLVINYQEGQIQWRWDRKCLEIYDAKTGAWSFINQDSYRHEEGYNENIAEDMYVEEVDTFLKAARGEISFPNDIDRDMQVLELLHQIEESDGGLNR